MHEIDGVCVLNAQPSSCSCMVAAQCQRVLEPTARCHRVGEKKKKTKLLPTSAKETFCRAQQGVWNTAQPLQVVLVLKFLCMIHVFYKLMFILLTHQSRLFILMQQSSIIVPVYLCLLCVFQGSFNPLAKIIYWFSL